MKKLIGTSIAVLWLLTANGVLAAGKFDNWQGSLSQDSSEADEYDSAKGKVVLNYRSGKDNWIINVNAQGLVPGVSYEVIFYDGNVHSLGCFVAIAGGTGHLNANGFSVADIDPTKPGPEPRVNVRLDNPNTVVCDGVADSAKLTTLSSAPWNSSGLVAVGSNRPE
ncbi:hypothetical protein A3D05_05100 [Candidatus Gottesmanbacteria bacterium RIFCSPHIGHO2_02_FULL_40_24]|nr:MAG: hypothetical protein A3D05_05100 [Candidatus Gottesmanbacteria bacterium RIFCSPHIGHO2_02_FULL_40_24]